MGREGFDGAEQEASTEAREAEGSDEDEAMAGKENASMQRAEGGGGATGGIKKKKPKRRAKGVGREVSKAAASCCTTGLGPRGMTVRYCPLRGA